MQTLDALVSARPSVEAWLALCGWLEAHPPGPRLERALDAVEEGLSAWPDALRRCPPAWARSLLRRPDPRLRAVRQVGFGRDTALIYDVDLPKLLERLEGFTVTGLRLAQQRLGVQGVRLVAEWPGAAKLRWLDLSRSWREGISGVKALAESPHLRGLGVLALSGVELSDRGLDALLASEVLDAVERLDLSNNGLSDRGVELLAQAGTLRHLRHLDLSHNRATDAGLAYLADHAVGLEALETLCVDVNAATAWSRERLLASERLVALEALERPPDAEDTPWAPGWRAASAQEANVRLQALRGLLYATPSPVVWERVCGLFDGWTQDDGLDVGLDYAQSVLAGWPDALRTCPRGWWQAAMEGRPHPGLALVRQLVCWERELGTRACDTLNHVWEQHTFTGLDASRLGLSLSGARALLANTHLPGAERLSVFLKTLTRDSVMDALDVCAWADTLTALEWRTFRFARGTFGRLLGHARLRGLARLELPSCGLEPDDLSALGDAQVLPHLHTLDLSFNPVGDALLTALASARGGARLEQLNLGGCAVTHVGLRALASATHMRDLRSLTLSQRYQGAAVPIDDFKRLFEARHLSALTHLHLDRNRLGPTGLRALASSPLRPNLHTLGLRDCFRGDMPLHALIDAPWPALHTLDASRCGISDRGVEAMVQRAELPSLQRLDLSRNDLSSRAARALASWSQARNLEALSLARNIIDDSGAVALAGSEHLRALTALDLDANPIELEGRVALANSPHLPEALRQPWRAMLDAMG